MRKRSVAERFWEKVRRGAPDECWVWTGGKTRAGYGMFNRGGDDGIEYAHRFVLVLDKVDVSGKFVCHRCDNPACVNPDHLFLGTQSDNMADCARKGRSASGTRNGQSKLSNTDVAAVLSEISSGTLHRELASRYGVSMTLISQIRNGKARTLATGLSSSSPAISGPPDQGTAQARSPDTAA